MYMYIYSNIALQLYIYIHIYTNMALQLYINIYMYIYIYTHICIYVYTRTHVCICTYVFVYPIKPDPSTQSAVPTGASQTGSLPKDRTKKTNGDASNFKYKGQVQLVAF